MKLAILRFIKSLLSPLFLWLASAIYWLNEEMRREKRNTAESRLIP